MINETQVRELVSRIVREIEQTDQKADMSVPVGVSNRHIHLSREHVEVLFGAGYQLTHLKDLSQPGQYACKETLTIIGPSMSSAIYITV